MDMSGMDMGGDGMDMGGQSHACKISMLWNWYTVDSCFLSEQWHVRSLGAFAGSVIAVFIITALVEGVRRAGREYDRTLVKMARARAAHEHGLADGNTSKGLDTPLVIKVTPTLGQQCIRALFFGVQFTVAYLLMLVAMYYNGYMLMGIILGGIAGYAVFARDTLGEIEHSGGASCC